MLQQCPASPPAPISPQSLFIHSASAVLFQHGRHLPRAPNGDTLTWQLTRVQRSASQVLKVLAALEGSPSLALLARTLLPKQHPRFNLTVGTSEEGLNSLQTVPGLPNPY